MNTFRKRLSILFIILAVFTVGFFYCFLYPRYTVPILMYHRFGPAEDNTLYVSPENFIRQLDFLARKKYNVISMEEYAEFKTAQKKFPRNTVVITLDDGFEDNYLYAYPELKEHGFPATIFLIANYIGSKEEYLTWDQVREMLRHNITFGAHTKNNVYLPSAQDSEELRGEIFGSKVAIEKQIEETVVFFCYPTGGFTEEVKDLARKAGYVLACTTNRGFSRYNENLFELKRIKVTNSDMNKPLSFRAKLSGYYNLFRSKKRGW